MQGRVLGLLLLGLAGLAPPGAQADPLELLRRPRNSVIGPPAGEGLDWVRAAEPLGKGRFRFRLVNRSQAVVLPEIGNGSAYTGTYAMAYGVTPNLEASFTIPFLMDGAAGYNKYGTGDPVLGVKYSRPAQVPASFYTAYQLLVGVPMGYKGEHALDMVGGIRPYSSESVDMGLHALADVHTRRLSLLLNLGYLRSGNPEVPAELAYGIGVETGRRNRWVSLSAEYWTRIAFSIRARAAAVLRVGARANLYRGLELGISREYGLLDHPGKALLTVGVRLHGQLTGRRSLEPRYALYRPPPPPKRPYRPVEVVRLVIPDFAGYEELQAGGRLVEKIRARLAPHDSIEVVELKGYADVPHRGELKPEAAVALARRLGADAVLTGTVSDYSVERFGGKRVPFVVQRTEARVTVGLDYRLVELSPDRTTAESFLNRALGHGRVPQPVRVLSADRREITASASAPQLHGAQEEALDDLVAELLATLAGHYPWVPPDFAP
ncbi:MAG: hypothetical protein AB1505_17010 [Candidatus Latescibacterota bacterium]